jgi:lipopolysaccharide/colanic/teichoic acid biosynthesis glycosyltransferase
MSVVGPRPERPEFSREYEQTTPAFSLRLQVKAGLTGYAQVYGRYNTKPMEKLQMDLIYINNMSIIEDLRLIFATLKILLIRESMVGVKQGRRAHPREGSAYSGENYAACQRYDLYV